MEIKIDPARVLMAAPVIMPMLEEAKANCVSQLVNAFRADVSDRQLRDITAQLSTLDSLKVSFQQRLDEANEPSK